MSTDDKHHFHHPFDFPVESLETAEGTIGQEASLEMLNEPPLSPTADDHHQMSLMMVMMQTLLAVELAAGHLSYATLLELLQDAPLARAIRAKALAIRMAQTPPAEMPESWQSQRNPEPVL